MDSRNAVFITEAGVDPGQPEPGPARRAVRRAVAAGRAGGRGLCRRLRTGNGCGHGGGTAARIGAGRPARPRGPEQRSGPRVGGAGSARSASERVPTREATRWVSPSDEPRLDRSTREASYGGVVDRRRTGVRRAPAWRPSCPARPGRWAPAWPPPAAASAAGPGPSWQAQCPRRWPAGWPSPGPDDPPSGLTLSAFVGRVSVDCCILDLIRRLSRGYDGRRGRRLGVVRRRPSAPRPRPCASTDRATTATASPALGVTNFTPIVDRPVGRKSSLIGLRTTWPFWRDREDLVAVLHDERADQADRGPRWSGPSP